MSDLSKDMEVLNALTEAMGNSPPIVRRPEWGVQDKDGATISTAQDPISTSTPQPAPAPHAPLTPTVPGSREKLFNGPPPPVTAPPVPPSQLQQRQTAVLSNIAAVPVAQPSVPPVELPKTGEKMIFLTGRSGSGKTYIAQKLRDNFVSVVIVDVIDSSRDFKAMKEAGFVHYHVVCSGMTLEGRQRRKQIQEPLAEQLDQSVKLTLIKGGSNNRLHVIWNDPAKIRPSDRLLTVDEFLSQF